LEHVVVYREPGRFAGWPANYGIWLWGDEIVLGFTLGYIGNDNSMHLRDKARPFLPMQARSQDGGYTWKVSPAPCRTPGGRGLSADEHVIPELQVAPWLDGPEGPVPPPGGFDFTHPDFALMCTRSGLEAGARSWFYVSFDRCRSWQGPFWLPDFGAPGVAARTDYVVLNAGEALLFLTVAKSDGHEGRPLCARMSEGGRRIEFLSWIGPEPVGYAIMPSTVRLADGTLLSAVRRSEPEGSWIDLYRSLDGGLSWEYAGRPVRETGRGGNPPALTLLSDGRLCITYGYRNEPYGIRAVLSEDEGRSWSSPIVLRADGGNRDLGYPRTVERPDGKLVTCYYFNDHAEGERYIGATIWQP